MQEHGRTKRQRKHQRARTVAWRAAFCNMFFGIQPIGGGCQEYVKVVAATATISRRTNLLEIRQHDAYPLCHMQKLCDKAADSKAYFAACML